LRSQGGTNTKMSSVINFIVEISDEKREAVTGLLKHEASSMGIGIWFDHFFAEDYVKEIASSEALIFELADDNEYCNCEALVEPWWYDEVGKDLFEKRMRFIEKIASLCLQYVPNVHLVIGTSGVQYAELPHVNITPFDFFKDIKQRYDECTGVPTPPDVHYIFVHP